MKYISSGRKECITDITEYGLKKGIKLRMILTVPLTQKIKLHDDFSR